MVRRFAFALNDGIVCVWPRVKSYYKNGIPLPPVEAVSCWPKYWM